MRWSSSWRKKVWWWSCKELVPANSTMSELGRYLIAAGALIALIGVVLLFAGKIPWLGRLPGDVYYKSDRVTVYFPLATCVVVSVVLSLLVYLFRR